MANIVLVNTRRINSNYVKRYATFAFRNMGTLQNRLLTVGVRPSHQSIPNRSFHISRRLCKDHLVFNFPSLAESDIEGVVKWEKNVGDEIAVNDIIIKLKVSVLVKSPVNGCLEEQLLPDGSSVKIGQQLGRVKILENDFPSSVADIVPEMVTAVNTAFEKTASGETSETNDEIPEVTTEDGENIYSKYDKLMEKYKSMEKKYVKSEEQRNTLILAEYLKEMIQLHGVHSMKHIMEDPMVTQTDKDALLRFKRERDSIAHPALHQEVN